MTAPSFRALATDRAFIAERIERLEQRLQRQGRGQRLLQGEATLGDLAHDIDGLARRIAGTLRRGHYRFSPVRQRTLVRGGKTRRVHQSELLDTIVQGVLGAALASALEPLFADSLHSYRRGRSSSTAVQALVKFLGAHRAARPDPRDRGLHVLRRDVRRYGESIPNQPDGPLFAKLEAALRARGCDQGELRWSLQILQGALRPDVLGLDGVPTPLPCGTPTGSALQPAINNLYLTELDRELADLAGEEGTSLRFGDDLLFAHPDAAVARAASEAIDRHLTTLGLTVNDDERADLYLTGCGRASSTWPGATGGSAVAFVGFDVGFDGRVGLKKPKRRELLRQLRTRWKYAQALDGVMGDATDDGDRKAEPARRAAVLCAVTNAALDPTHPLCVPLAPALRHLLSDRSELARLDYQIALELACALTGRRGPRAFRGVSYGSLRREAGLVSLVVARNRSTSHPFGAGAR